MKSTSRSRFATILLGQMALLGSGYAGTAWTVGGVDTNINTASNWGGTVNAINGTTVATFSAGSDATMNVPARFTTLTFSNASASGFTVGGASTLSVNQATAGATINLGISDTANNGITTINSPFQVNTDAGGANRFLNILNSEKDISAGSLVINGNLSTSNATNTVQIRAGGTGVTVFNGTLSNVSGIQQVNSGTSSGKVIVNGNQTLGSSVTVNVPGTTSGTVTSAYTIQMGNSTSDLQSWGNTTVNQAATVQVRSTATLSGGVSLGIGTGSSSSGGTLQVIGNLTATTLTIGSSSNSGILKVSGTATFTGAISNGATAGSKIVGDNSSNGILTLSSGTISSALTIGGAGTNENKLNLIKANAGTLTVSGTHTYTGSTTVNGGTLALSSGTTLGTSGITVNNGGTLSAAATGISSSVLVNSGGTLSGEGNSGALSFGNGTSTFNFDATTPGAFTAASYSPNSSALVLLTPTGSTSNGTPYLVLTSTAGFGSSVPSEFAASSRGTLALAGSNTQINFTPTGAASLVWKGNVSGSWDVVNSQNWTNSGYADRFYASDSVTFDDTATTGTVTVSGSAVSVGGLSFANDSQSYALSGQGITIAGALTKSGSGNVTIANTVTAAGVTVSGGSLALNAAANLGASDITVGNGTLTLGAANTATGNITINSGGTLTAGITGALGTTTSRNVLLNGGTLNYNGAATISSDTLNLSISGDSTVGVGTSTATLRVGGTFSGSADLTVGGPGILALGKNSADSAWGSGYSGNITVSNGSVVSLRNEQSLGNTTGATTVQSGGTVMLDPFGQTAVSFGENIAFQGNSTLSNRYNGQASLANTLTGTITTAGTLGVNTLSSSANSAMMTFSGAIGGAGGVNFGAPISFTGLSGSSVATVPGTYVLNAANTYSGPTTLTSGTVRLGASERISNSSTLVMSGGALDLNGFSETFGGLDLNANSTIALGASNSISFGASAGLDWGAFTLNFTSVGGSLSANAVRFGTDASGLSVSQLGLITVNGTSGFGLDANGFLTAIPEPSAFGALAGLGALGLVASRRRRRA